MTKGIRKDAWESRPTSNKETHVMQRYVAIAALMVGELFAGSFAVVVVLGAWWSAQAQDAKTPYPSMAPLDQYLMADRSGEIALARRAAPEAISREATVMVLG